MLVLTRKIGECIIILLPTGEKVTVKVIGVDSHGAIKLGIDAPRHIQVHRSEILERIAQGKPQ